MSRTFDPLQNHNRLEFNSFIQSVIEIMSQMPPLDSRGNLPLQMSFKAHKSAEHLLHVLEKDAFARNTIAPEKGIKKNSFSEADNGRGLEQFMYVFQNLQAQSSKILPKRNPKISDLMDIDGSLIDGILSMFWADYREKLKMARAIYYHRQFNERVSIKRVC